MLLDQARTTSGAQCSGCLEQVQIDMLGCAHNYSVHSTYQTGCIESQWSDSLHSTLQYGRLSSSISILSVYIFIVYT